MLLAGCGGEPRWTTSSPEALRAYDEGVTHWQLFYYTEALASFQKSIAADSNFALPWGRLAMLHMNTLDDCAAQLDAVQRWFDELGQTSLRLPETVACNDDISLLEAA